MDNNKYFGQSKHNDESVDYTFEFWTGEKNQSANYALTVVSNELAVMDAKIVILDWSKSMAAMTSSMREDNIPVEDESHHIHNQRTIISFYTDDDNNHI